MITQAAYNAPAALISHVNRATPRKTGADTVGMTMWFRVTLEDHSGGLGFWSSCTGLSVRFERDQVTQGNDYTAARVVPTRLTYPDITLQRAMTPGNARNVAHWLAKFAKDWLNGETTLDQEGATMTIELHSRVPEADNTMVQSWTLRNVFPVSWSAPPLSSGQGDVAVETLVLSHQGFLNVDRAGRAGGGTGQKIMLRLSGDGGKAVELPVPDTMTLDKTVAVDQGAEKFLLSNLTMTNPGKLGVTFSALVVEGVQRIAAVEGQLWEWMAPIAVADGQEKGSRLKPRPVTVQLGEQKAYKGILTSLTVEYVRFDPAGKPCRAKVTLKLQQGDDEPQTANATVGAPAAASKTSDDVDDKLRARGAR